LNGWFCQFSRRSVRQASATDAISHAVGRAARTILFPHMPPAPHPRLTMVCGKQPRHLLCCGAKSTGDWSDGYHIEDAAPLPFDGMR
jgi:hypothetical protein